MTPENVSSHKEPIPTWQLELWRYNLEQHEMVPTWEPLRDAFISLLYEVLERR